MKKRYKIYFLLFLAALIAITCISYFFVKKYEITDTAGIINNQALQENDSSKQPEEKINTSDIKYETISEEQAPSYENIEKEDCLNGCSDFKIDSEKEYCEKVCSGSPIENDDSCSEKSGIQKDYCYKNLGIKNNNFDECKKIADKNIRESCANTVSENILERGDGVEQRNP